MAQATTTNPADFSFRRVAYLEKEMFNIYDESIDYKKRLLVVDAFINAILIEPKADYNSDEQAEIIKYWNLANKLIVEEKKR